MGNIDDVVPFFGRTFNKIYPLIMVVYTLLVAVNFFEHLIDFFGSLKRFKCWTDQEGDMDGLDPSGVFILQKGKNFATSSTLCLNLRRSISYQLIMITQTISKPCLVLREKK